MYGRKQWFKMHFTPAQMNYWLNRIECMLRTLIQYYYGRNTFHYSLSNWSWSRFSAETIKNKKMISKQWTKSKQSRIWMSTTLLTVKCAIIIVIIQLTSSWFLLRFVQIPGRSKWPNFKWKWNISEWNRFLWSIFEWFMFR